MKKQELIKQVRESTQQLWNIHVLYLNTNGAQGLRCFHPQELWRQLQRSDQEIINEALALGIKLED